jgi:hypothetical protein
MNANEASIKKIRFSLRQRLRVFFGQHAYFVGDIAYIDRKYLEIDKVRIEPNRWSDALGGNTAGRYAPYRNATRRTPRHE